MKRLWPHFPAPLVAIGGAIAAAWYFGLQDKGFARRLDSAGIPVADAARPEADRVVAAGRARHRVDELHRNDRRRSRLPDPGEPPIDPNNELIATGAGNLVGALLGAMPGGGGASQTALVRNTGVGHRRRRSSPPASRSRPCCSWRRCWAAAARDACGTRHRLFDRADPAGRVHRDTQVRTMEFRWAVAAALGVLIFGTLRGHRRGDHPVADRPGEPDRAAAPARHRPQARRRRAASAVARTPRRRDLRGPADRAAGGPPVLRQRADMSASRSRRWSPSTSRASWRWT